MSLLIREKSSSVTLNFSELVFLPLFAQIETFQNLSILTMCYLHADPTCSYCAQVGSWRDAPSVTLLEASHSSIHSFFQ